MSVICQWSSDKLQNKGPRTKAQAGKQYAAAGDAQALCRQYARGSSTKLNQLSDSINLFVSS